MTSECDTMTNTQQYSEDSEEYLIKIYKIKINYISGRSESFWCKKYELDSNGLLTYTVYCNDEYPVKPIIIRNQFDQIESIWQVEMKDEVEEDEDDDAGEGI